MKQSVPATARVAIVYHSGYGHTRAQAEAVHRGAAGVAGVTADLVAVEAIEANWQLLDDADAIVFGAPTYMAGPSAAFKTFLDATSARWAKQAWRDKLAAGFTNSGSLNGDKLATLQALALAAMQHGMVWIGLSALPGQNGTADEPANHNRLGSWLGAMAQSPPGAAAEAAPPPADRGTAALLGRRVAEAALRWRRATAGPEDAAVRALLEQYLDGLHRSDAGLLARVFHPAATYATATPGAAGALDTATTPGSLVHLDVARYLQVVGRRTSPASRGEARCDHVVSVEFAGPVTARAHLHCSLGGKRYEDFLTLVKADGRWQILAKVFHFAPAEQPCLT